jgi:phosphoribosylformylglycinamidine synthase PurS subunit
MGVGQFGKIFQAQHIDASYHESVRGAQKTNTADPQNSRVHPRTFVVNFRAFPMKAIVTVTPKKSILDPQGDAVRKAIHHLGMECVESVRVGKHIELEISGTNVEKTREKLDQVAKELLSNPVIEDYKIEIY